MDLTDLIKKLADIKSRGFITTHRVHDTGIGKTLEDLLGIPENNLQIPDIGDVELKAKRIDSSSMLTIATKTPKPRGINRQLFNTYKYSDATGCYNLHSTVVGSRQNPQGFQIELTQHRLVLKNLQGIEAYWDLSVFNDVLKTKSEKILLVFAKTQGQAKTATESFHYTEAYLLETLNLTKFENAIRADKLKIDIRIGSYRSGTKTGQYHDHGTGFRIQKADFLALYDNYRQLI